jgi:hypothetical protein
MKASLEPKEQ